MPLTGPDVYRVRLEKASWDEIRRITDKLLPGWIRALMAGFEKTRAGVGIRALIRLLEGEETDAVLNAIDWINIDGPLADTTRAAIPILMRDAIESSATTAAGLLERSRAVRVVGAFDVVNPRSAEWIRAHAGALITEITESSRQAIRDLIERAYMEGIPAPQLARLIRSSIGLTTRQARAVANLRARMVRDGKRLDKIEEVVDRYAARLLRRRAEMIARTELIRAETEGQLELWRQQVEAGMLEAGVLKEWIVTEDDRLCPQCQDLDGITSSLDGLFPSGVDGPPLHPNCRCSFRLTFPKAERIAA